MNTWHDLGIDASRIKGQGKLYCPKCHHTRRPEHRSERELSINTDTGAFYCHNPGCEWNTKGLYLNRRDDPFAPTWVRPTQPERVGLTNAGRTWLNDRSIDFTVAEQMGVWDDGKTIAFPYVRDGYLIHVKYRSLAAKRWWATPESEPVFYNLAAVRDAATIIVVEGELDVLALATAGITNAISVPNGAPGDGQDAGKKLACMATAGDLFARAERVIIATDNDAPGRELAKHLVRRIGPEKCWRVDWPNGTKDANECLENYDAAVLEARIANARPEPYKGLIYALDVADDVWDSRLLPDERGVSTGIPSLDRYYRPDIGHMTTWSGTPSSGKSAFLAYAAHNIAREQGWRYVVFTPETYPASEYYRELVQIHTGKPLRQVDEASFRAAMAWINEHFIIQAPPEPTLLEILDHARVAVQRHGVNAVIIDPFTNIILGGASDKSRKDAIDESLVRIQSFGTRYRCHMDVIAHPTKPMKNRDGDIEPIGPYDISGTAGWFNHSDEMVMIHRTSRDRADAPVEVRVWKMRSRYHGKVGQTQVQFHPATGRYTDLGTPF